MFADVIVETPKALASWGSAALGLPLPVSTAGGVRTWQTLTERGRGRAARGAAGRPAVSGLAATAAVATEEERIADMLTGCVGIPCCLVRGACETRLSRCRQVQNGRVGACMLAACGTERAGDLRFPETLKDGIRQLIHKILVLSFPYM